MSESIRISNKDSVKQTLILASEKLNKNQRLQSSHTNNVFVWFREYDILLKRFQQPCLRTMFNIKLFERVKKNDVLEKEKNRSTLVKITATLGRSRNANAILPPTKIRTVWSVI